MVLILIMMKLNMKNNKIKIIVIGTGAYTKGTILPALLTYAQKFKVNLSIVFGCNSVEGQTNILREAESLKTLLGVDVKIESVLNIDEGSLPNKKHTVLENCIGFNRWNYDVVAGIVATPDEFHYKWIKQFILNKVPVLSVKPLTLSLKESLELTKIAKKLQVPAFVEFHKRYDRQLRYAKDEYSTLGELLYCYTEYTQRKTIREDTFRKWSNKTNIFSYLGVHYVDAIRYITKATPIKVSATGQKQYLIDKSIDTYDSIQANILWKTNFQWLGSGFDCYEWNTREITFNQTINCSWVESNYSSSVSAQNLNLVFANGRINCEQKDRGLSILRKDESTEHINPDFCRRYGNTFEGYGIDAYINFIHCISENPLGIMDDRMCSFEEACISTSVIEAANKSLKNNSKWIKL